MFVAIDAPELGVGDEHVRKDLRFQLRARDLRPIIVLELHEHTSLSGLRTRQEALILLHVESTIRLERGIAQDTRGRIRARLLDDFFVTDANAALAVFL